jgi:CelD/BcsL family acetyltransferase involved in cellulose biosynthesis
MIGSGTLDYEDFIVEANRDHARICQQILNVVFTQGGWDFFKINRFREESASLHALNSILSAHRGIRSVSHPFAVAPYIPINCSWDSFWVGLKKELRKDSERQIRRLTEQEGQLEYRRPCSAAEVERFCIVLVKQHVRRRRELKNDYSLFEVRRFVDFHTDLAQRLHEAGTLDLTAMCLGPKLLAIHYGARYAGTYYYLFPTFDDAYGKYSVGRLLLLHLLKECFDDGMHEFDMLVGDETYKHQYASHAHQLFSLAVYNQSIKGRLAHLWFADLRHHLRQTPFFTRLIPSLRRAGVLRRFS